MLTVTDIARVCHEASRAYSALLGDDSQVPWDVAPEWLQASVIQGVEHRLAHPDAPVSASHEAWMAEKLAAGWAYGLEKDAQKKRHPCLLPFSQLAPAQQAKDRLFVAIVRALAPAARFAYEPERWEDKERGFREE